MYGYYSSYPRYPPLYQPRRRRPRRDPLSYYLSLYKDYLMSYAYTYGSSMRTDPYAREDPRPRARFAAEVETILDEMKSNSNRGRGRGRDRERNRARSPSRSPSRARSQSRARSKSRARTLMRYPKLTLRQRFELKTIIDEDTCKYRTRCVKNDILCNVTMTWHYTLYADGSVSVNHGFHDVTYFYDAVTGTQALFKNNKREMNVEFSDRFLLNVPWFAYNRDRRGHIPINMGMNEYGNIWTVYRNGAYSYLNNDDLTDVVRYYRRVPKNPDSSYSTDEYDDSRWTTCPDEYCDAQVYVFRYPKDGMLKRVVAIL